MPGSNIPVLEGLVVEAPLDSELLQPVFEVWGSCKGPVFTAPHGIGLSRDDRPAHLPEDFTTFLARVWAAGSDGRSLVWGAGALEFSFETEKTLPGARDPNFLLEEEMHGNAWVRALSACEGRRLHIDVHGKADRPGEADLDIGVGACRERFGQPFAASVADRVHSMLSPLLGDAGFSSDPLPRLQGAWRKVPRKTLTQASAHLGFTSVQLEIGYRLRKALARDQKLCHRIGGALAGALQSCKRAAPGAQ